MSPRRLVAIVAAFALALSVGACTSHKPKPVTKDIGAGVAATSTELRSDLKAVANASVPDPAPDEFPELLTHVISVTPSGPLKSTQLTFTLKQKVPADDAVAVFTKEDGEADWTPLASTLAADRQHVTVSPTHLSDFIVKLIGTATKAVADFLEKTSRQIVDDVTSNLFTSAQKPACNNITQALKDGYQVQLSSPQLALYQCLGMDGSHRELKIVNRLKIPLKVNYADMALKSVSSKDLTVENIVGKSTSNLSRLLDPGSKYVIIMPYEEADFTVVDLAEGHYARLSTEFSGPAMSLYQLEFNVALVAQMVAKFSSKAKLLISPHGDEMLKLVDELFHDRDCFDAVVSLNVGSALANCFSDKTLEAALGVAMVVVAGIVKVITSILDYLDRQAQSLVADILHQDVSVVAVVRSKPMANPFVGTWKEGSSNLHFNADGKTATRHWVLTACARGTSQCVIGDATLSVKVSGNTATLTYLTVKFTYPPGVVGDIGGGEPQAGDREILKLLATGLVSRTYKEVNPRDYGPAQSYTHYWCGQGVSASNRKKCNIVSTS